MMGQCYSCSRSSESACVPLIADLEIPAIRIREVKALELAVHVRLRVQSPFFQFGFHFGSVPGIDAPGDVVDQTRNRWLIRTFRCVLVSGAISHDDAAHIANLHRALLLAIVVNNLPTHKVAIESGASPIVGDSIGNVIEPHRLPGSRRARWRDGRLCGLFLRGRKRSRSGRHAKSKRLDQLPARQLPRLKILQQSADDPLHRTSSGLGRPNAQESYASLGTLTIVEAGQQSLVASGWHDLSA